MYSVAIAARSGVLLDVCTVASSSMQTGCVEGRTKTLLMLLCSKATQRSGHIMAWGSERRTRRP